MGKHIEALLQDCDCVVLPAFGAFIAHPVAAYYADGEHLYFPPSRALSFNSELTTDDGLLTSRLMHVGNMDFSTARHAVDVYVDYLRQALAADGCVQLEGIGHLRQDMAGNISYEPTQKGIVSPSHFGLDALAVYDLTSLERASSALQFQPSTGSQPFVTKSEHTIDLHIGKQTLRRVASVAAAMLLLIVFALPVSDERQTEIASLAIYNNKESAPEQNVVRPSESFMASDKEMPTEMFQPTESVLSPESALTEETIQPSAIAQPLEAAQPSETGQLSETVKPVEPAVSLESANPSNGSIEPAIPTESVNHSESAKLTESVAPAETPRPSRIYHVIAGSLPSSKGAEAIVEKYKGLGFSTATTVEGDGRVRISIASFTDKAEGEAFIDNLRQNESYKKVWLLSVRVK